MQRVIKKRTKFDDAERWKMCRFLISELENDNKDAKFPGGNEIWKKAKKEKLFPGHTHKSLRDHFLRDVYHRLKDFTSPDGCSFLMANLNAKFVPIGKTVDDHDGDNDLNQELDEDEDDDDEDSEKQKTAAASSTCIYNLRNRPRSDAQLVTSETPADLGGKLHHSGESSSSTSTEKEAFAVGSTAVQKWNVEDVCRFVVSVGDTASADLFRKQEIDGKALLLLTSEMMSRNMNVRLGPALKIANAIEKIKASKASSE